MPGLQKVIIDWTGFQGAPGYSILYRSDTTPAVDNIRTFLDSVKALLPSGVNVKVRTSGDIVDSSTGALTGSWSVGASAAVVGIASGSYVGGAGAVVRWLTDGIVGGHRVRGRTFLVPLVYTAFESNGTLAAGTVTTILAAAAALVTSEGTEFGVWHRPVNGGGGQWFNVVGADVPDRSALMRSRRD